MRPIVIIVDYDPHWPMLYEEEKKRILKAVGDLVLAIEHIGSTSVPGLAAKPIIDIMAGVAGPAKADECVERLKEIEFDDITIPGTDPDWYYCLGKRPHSIGFHMHLVRFESNHWKRHIIFRDYLRTHKEVAKRYEELKMRLASELGSNREAYTESKASFIDSTVSQAVKEREYVDSKSVS